MKKLQASMRDKAAKSWNERKLYYKVGSYFKGCHNCGIREYNELPSGRIEVRYTSGHQVFRSFSPKGMGWTYWCYECGAKDLQCWDGANDIGMEAITGNRDAVRRAKAAVRKDAVINKTPVIKQANRGSEIERLEAELNRLMNILKGQM